MPLLLLLPVVYCIDRDPSDYAGVSRSIVGSGARPARKHSRLSYCWPFFDPPDIPQPPSQPAQYEIELFRRVWQQLGPTWEDARLNWTCMDYTEVGGVQGQPAAQVRSAGRRTQTPVKAYWRRAALRASTTRNPPIPLFELQLKDHLAAGDGVCDLGVAGIGLSTENLERGLTFTLPTLR